MTRLATRILIVAGIVCLLLAFLWLRSCDQARSAKTQANLSKNQAGAAIESGHDAVETLGNAGAREAEIHTTAKDGTDAIEKAPAGDSNAAAERAACGMRSYRHLPKCIALLGPVAK
jgi:hypothetical protein